MASRPNCFHRVQHASKAHLGIGSYTLPDQDQEIRTTRHRSLYGKIHSKILILCGIFNVKKTWFHMERNRHRLIAGRNASFWFRFQFHSRRFFFSGQKHCKWKKTLDFLESGLGATKIFFFRTQCYQMIHNTVLLITILITHVNDIMKYESNYRW